MKVLVALGGIAGVYALAIALFGMEYVYPRWKRWLLGFVGAALVLTFLTLRDYFPNGSGEMGDDCDPGIPHRYGGC